MSQTHYPAEWIPRLCGLMLIPTCQAVTDVFTAWARAEGGTAQWNPQNTTYRMPGSWNYNSAGVQNYSTPIAGISATALTLALEPYHTLWVDMQRAKSSGTTAKQLVEQNAHAFDTWGTGAAHVLALLT